MKNNLRECLYELHTWLNSKTFYEDKQSDHNYFTIINSNLNCNTTNVFELLLDIITYFEKDINLLIIYLMEHLIPILSKHNINRILFNDGHCCYNIGNNEWLLGINNSNKKYSFNDQTFFNSNL